MPGKHAPESPASFYLSVARAVGGALVVLGVVAVIAIAATGGGGKKPAAQKTTPPPTVSTNPTVSSTPSTSTSPTANSNLARITVDVFNGTQRAGLATGLANKLKADGYTVKTVGNQAKHQAQTTIYYRVGFKAAADALLAAHPELKRVAEAPASQTETLTVVIGDDYKAA